ncbi:MAG TPA: Dna2/Cas4 domain-containing protein [Ignavibacteria bacterium]|nr:Dna2/Cas4 domain-containing protein [Ignavibacteria bacterium]
MKITGSLIQAYTIFSRQAWLMSRQMSANQNDSFLEIGRLINKTTFRHEKKKIYLAEFAAEIDFITLKNGCLFAAEIKKSSRTMASSIKQLKYYLYLFSKKGIKCKGVIKITKEKISMTIEFQEGDVVLIKEKIVNFAGAK